MLKITDATYLTSAVSKTQFIHTDKPIIAVSGKSNVGKSSFINMLAGRNKLARVSKEPGRTRMVNYFDFGPFILADLPGYGYARVSQAEKQRWGKLMQDFFADSSNVTHVISLCDVRHPPTQDDKDMIHFLYAGLIPFTVAATKADKVSRMAAKNGARLIANTFACGEDNVIITSSETKQGREEVLARIEHIINLFEENKSEDKTEGEENL
ncbi:MAG: ribosome biogenesis GTP-binding protein YihA/YsxC [Clostridia bacterium]|nr:ribosome biogenesis GTP-binding protein YihA/YsxC [Clostridia bacterium]